jgi:hypothetical protein
MMAGTRASMRRLLISGVLGAALLGCGEAADGGGAPGSTAGAVTAVATATPSPAPAATPAPTETTAATPLRSSVPAPPPTSPPTAAAPAGVALPDPRRTPGETFPGVTVAQICTSGYSSSVRHVEHQQYVDVYAAYGVPYPEPSGTYELDHLIPLELGGDNSDANLWPEPASPTPGFHQKDDLENRMHDLVCAGRLDLHEAQREIATNWYAAYVRYVGG